MNIANSVEYTWTRRNSLRPEAWPAPKRLCSICFEHQDARQFIVKCCSEVCLTCVRKYAESRLAERDVILRCPYCSETWSEDQTTEYLGQDIIDIKNQIEQEQKDLLLVRDSKFHFWCPSPDCNTILSLNSRNSRKCSCDKCQKDFCIDCKMSYHGTGPCPHSTAEEASAWLEENTKPCPTCKTRIEKNLDFEDCNHMICGVCNTEFCWLCGEKIPILGHFDRRSDNACAGLQYYNPNATSATQSLAKRQLNKTIKGAALALAFPFFIISSPFWVAKACSNVRRRRRRRSAVEPASPGRSGA